LWPLPSLPQADRFGNPEVAQFPITVEKRGFRKEYQRCYLSLAAYVTLSSLVRARVIASTHAKNAGPVAVPLPYRIAFSTTVCIPILNPKALYRDQRLNLGGIELPPNTLLHSVQLRISAISGLGEAVREIDGYHDVRTWRIFLVHVLCKQGNIRGEHRHNKRKNDSEHLFLIFSF
jgi:hypothetical protein